MKILIIDDEVLVRKSLSRVLSASFEVVEAIDGKQGMELWEQHKPAVVVLDVLMPVYSGPQVLQMLSPEIRSQSKVILISAYTGEYNVETARDLGVDLFIAKPFEDIFTVRDQIIEISKQVRKSP